MSSAGAMDGVARLMLPPFQPRDALICTSHAALVVVGRLQDEMRGWMREHLGATRFNPVRTPVIPLGVNAPSFATTPAERAAARAELALGEDDVASLFAGRLSFHAKANPAPFYQAVEATCRRTGGGGGWWSWRRACVPTTPSPLPMRRCEACSPHPRGSYAALDAELGELRRAAPPAAIRWPLRPDPFALFSHYPTAVVGPDWTVAARGGGGVALAALRDLGVARYGFDPQFMPRAAVEAVRHALAKGGEQPVGALLAGLPGERAANRLALMWLAKFGLAAVKP